MEVDNKLPMGNFNFGDHIIPAIGKCITTTLNLIKIAM